MAMHVECLALAGRWPRCPLPDGLVTAERLYRARRFPEALVAGQALLTEAAADDDEQGRVHAFVASCLTALNAHALAARHDRLARACGAESHGEALVGERRLPCNLAKQAYWPTERRGRG